MILQKRIALADIVLIGAPFCWPVTVLAPVKRRW
jgi:hypothetical protein